MSDSIERDLAEAAILKRRAGKRPTAQESAALRRVSRRKEAEDRRRYYATVSKRDYQELSGRSDKVLLEQATRHGLPLRGKTVDLFALIRRFHDYLAENRTKLSRDDAGDGETKPEAERRETIARANLREIKAREAAGELVPTEAVRRLLVQHVSEAKAIFDQVADRVLSALPQRLKAGVRRRIRQDVQKIIDDTCESLADMLADSRLPEEKGKETI